MELEDRYIPGEYLQISRGNAVGRVAVFSKKSAISPKRGKIEPRLLLITTVCVTALPRYSRKCIYALSVTTEINDLG